MAEWGLDDYAEMREFWRDAGPPPHITLGLIARVLGVDFEKLRGTDPQMASLEPMGGPSITELSAMFEASRAGGDTSAASQKVIRAMSERKGNPDGDE